MGIERVRPRKRRKGPLCGAFQYPGDIPVMTQSRFDARDKSGRVVIRSTLGQSQNKNSERVMGIERVRPRKRRKGPLCGAFQYPGDILS